MRLPFTGYELKFQKREALDPDIKPDDDRWYTPFLWSQNSSAGVAVNKDTAIRLSAVYACIKILSETLASVPLILYQHDGDNKKRAVDHPLYKKLGTYPCKLQNLTSMQWRMMMMIHALTTGNGFSKKIMTRDGRNLMDIQILDPTRVVPRIDLELKRKVYDLKLPDGTSVTYDWDEIIHIMPWTLDGITGVSPITYHREAIGLGLAAEQFGASFFGNAAAPAGVLELGPDLELSDKARERLKADFKAKYAGPSKVGEVAILEEGITWKTIGISNRDAQYIDLRKMQVEEICRIFRVPPHMVGMLDRATFSNIEQQQLSFHTNTMLPHFTLWEETLQRDLLSVNAPYFFEFLLAGLMRGDIETRYRAYATGRQWGWLSINDIRGFENMNSIGEAGDVFLTPLNMVNAEALEDPDFGKPIPPASSTAPDGAEDDEEDGDEPKPKDDSKKESKQLMDYAKALARHNQTTRELVSRHKAAQVSTFSDTIARLLRRGQETFEKKQTNKLSLEKYESFYKGFPAIVKDSLRNASLAHAQVARALWETNGVECISDAEVVAVVDQKLDKFSLEYFASYAPADESRAEALSALLVKWLTDSVLLEQK